MIPPLLKTSMMIYRSNGGYMKTCGRCKIGKHDEEFNKYSRGKSGLQSYCRDCNNEYRVRYRLDPANREAHTAGNKTYKTNNPKKIIAHNMVGYALRKGTLLKNPCWCGSSENLCGHHDDYDKPLEVRWLCHAHHAEWHKEHGEALNG